MLVLYTGAGGFLGSHVCDELLRRWHPQYTLEQGLKKTIDFWKRNWKHKNER